jgi:hypothetical protein
MDIIIWFDKNGLVSCVPKSDSIFEAICEVPVGFIIEGTTVQELMSNDYLVSLERNIDGN